MPFFATLIAGCSKTVSFCRTISVDPFRFLLTERGLGTLKVTVLSLSQARISDRLLYYQERRRSMKNESKSFEELFKSYRKNKRLLELAEKINSAKEPSKIEYVNPYLMSAMTRIKVVGEYRG